MNIIKGIDRIALVLAIIAIVPSFIVGWKICKTKQPAKQKLEVPYKKPVSLPLVGPWLNKKGKKTTLPAWDAITESEDWANCTPDERRNVFQAYKRDLGETKFWKGLNGDDKFTIVRQMEKDAGFYEDPYKYKYRPPSSWQCAKAGIFGAGIAFLIVLFGVRTTTRVSLWIIAGFIDEKQPEK